MLKKSLKKFTGILATTMIMANTIGRSVPVMAANTSDTIYRINVESSTGSYKRVQERDKQNNTKVYVNITASPTQYTRVQTYGNRNTTSFYNETKGTYATVKKGVPSSITNYCYEHKKSNYTYVLAKVGFKSSSSVTGSVEGVWSPDSTKNYTIVN